MRTDDKRDQRRGPRELRIKKKQKNTTADDSALLHLLKDLKNDNWILMTRNPTDNLMRDNAA